MTTATSADSGVLSLDDAVAQLSSGADEHEQTQTAETGVTTEQTETATDRGEEAHEIQEAGSEASDAEGAEGQTEGEAEEQEGEQGEAEAELQPLEAPKFWDADQKQRFAELPRDIQEYILKKEDERNVFTSRQAQEAAEKRKAADAEAQKLATLAAGLDQLLPRANKVFADRWSNVDWNAVLEQYGTEQYLKLQNQMKAEQAELTSLERAKGATEQAQYERFVQTESAKLNEMVPDFADPKQGKARKEATIKFLVDNHVPVERLKDLTALEAALAYDAMRWRNGQATAEKLKAQKKPVVPTQKTQAAKPGANARPTSPQQAKIKALQSKRSLTIDEAVELADLTGS